MKPPNCIVCGKNLHEYDVDKFELFYFDCIECEIELEICNKNKCEPVIGHPKNAFWFCQNHIYIGKIFKNNRVKYNKVYYYIKKIKQKYNNI
jgi:hypothetical protein